MKTDLSLSAAADFAAQLRAIHEGDAWHGPALRELLSGLSPAQAASRPFPKAHNIWEVVLHIAAWENVYRQRLAGMALDKPDEGNFPRVESLTPAAWEQALAHLERVHKEFHRAVASLPESAFEQIVPGRPFTVRFMLQSAIRHHVCHAGQIALLKKAVVPSGVPAL
ncbi:MAG: DinB family protein [Acidobacteriia bacterium]|nr:DinB family protein [Terriglobia bacterium]